MKIGVLTSSRADFGIYLPLLQELKKDSFFDLTIIAFGTHVSPYHGETITQIKDIGFKKIDHIQSLLLNDDPNGISTSYGLTVSKFADYWEKNSYDLVFCLGDRFEMSAAVQSGIPFGIKFAHIHGGETTLGAIDNIYRHQITLASILHFASTVVYVKKIEQLIESSYNVHNVGSLSLDHIEDFPFTKELSFREQFGIPNQPYILITFHPETVAPELNIEHAQEMKTSLKLLAGNFFLVITMPNADTNGSIFRKAIESLKSDLTNQMVCVENFGKINYFNAVRYSEFLVGNTSSGIIEAASFGKYVVNVGNRQKGRAKSENVFDCAFKKDDIIKAVEKIKKLGSYTGNNIYKKTEPAKVITKELKKYYAAL